MWDYILLVFILRWSYSEVSLYCVSIGIIMHSCEVNSLTKSLDMKYYVIYFV